MKIGIFGGSFNPVHIGHQAIVSKTLDKKIVDKIIIIPNYQNPLKDKLPEIPPDIRWSMLEKVFKNIKNSQLSDIETKNKSISYTYLTLEKYADIYQKDELYLMLGEDAFSLIDLWKKPKRVFELANILIYSRPKMKFNQLKKIAESYSANIELLDIEIPNISSTEIRECPAERAIKRGLIPSEVFDIWKKFKKNKRH